MPASFTGPGGKPAGPAIRATVQALTTPTTGDLLAIGQVFRSRIRRRTQEGVDVDGVPFAPYSKNGPYYLYVNGAVGLARGGTPATRAARATASRNRHIKTGRIGVRTPFGIKYESYAAAKTAHGRANVDLYGLQQHTHMLDTMLVRAGGSEVDATAGELDFGSEFVSFENLAPTTELQIGFYGPEAARAQGNNEGTGRVPRRRFFALNAEDLQMGEKMLVDRMTARAKARDK